MKISVFTPLHKRGGSLFIKEAYESLKKQTHTDWEWIILLNGEGVGYYGVQGKSSRAEIQKLQSKGESLPSDNIFGSIDERIKIYIAPKEMAGNIGALKKLCCEYCSGDVLLELDWDDILTNDCLEEVDRAFTEDEKVKMVYSNCCEFHSGTWLPNTYNEYFGWRTRPFTYEGKELLETISWPPSAQMMRQIFWAPNHVRAWRATSYIEIGGHDDKLKVGDDHDLCCRYYVKYGVEGFKHIDKCLYLYRVHPNNNVKLLNSQIQKQTDDNYCKYSRPMAKKWAQENNLRILDLGGRFGAWEGYETVDLLDADIIADLNGTWPFEDNSIGVIKAHHVFEHLKDSIHTFNEAFRVLAPGGFLFVEVPSADGRGGLQDPTHCSFFNTNSFWYYTRESHAKYIRPMYKGKFQMSRIVEWYPSEFEKLHDIKIIEADMICLKPPFTDRVPGEVLI